ncbi:MAG: MFS transporter [Candidatus Accumulibacter sp.]|nr:MFS transporter [Accumulibacter sp.]
MSGLSATPTEAGLQRVAPLAPASVPVTLRLIVGLCGLFLAATLGGLNNRLGTLGLDDIRGVFGFSNDDATWLTSFYAAGELVIMPFVAWLVSIFSLKRLETFMLVVAVGLACVFPCIHNLHLLVALRFFQAAACGALIFMFMISLFFLLPAHRRMYGFGFYAMVATFAPNMGVWLTALWTDTLHGWEFLYWQSVLLGIPALSFIQYGLPDTPGNPDRLRNSNWLGMAFAVPGTLLLALALSQGIRLDWFHSPFITWALASGLALLVLYVISELNHANPFLQLRVFTHHRNVWMALLILVVVLTVSLAGVMLPVSYLGRVWAYRPLQSASVGLVIALPQFITGPVVAFALYRRWLDARAVYIVGFLMLILGCALGARLDGEWLARHFYASQALLALGLPTAIISTIYMASNNINIAIGPSLGGAINTVRCLGTLAGSAILGQYLATRQHTHYEWLRDKTGLLGDGGTISLPDLTQVLNSQSSILATADAYCLLGALAVCPILIILCMRYTPPPQAPQKT